MCDIRGGIGPVALMMTLLWLVGPLAAQTPASSAAPPPAVTVVKIEQRDVTPSTSFTGRAEAIDKVDLRARVEGFIEQRKFEEGADIATGQLLFVMEKGPYKAKVDEAKAAILAAEGSLKLADIEVDRQGTLVQRQATAQARLDEANAKQAQARGALLGHQATLDKAELDLSYTDIKSPIAGRIGRAAFSIGDLVGPGSEPLATVVSQDPMYVLFPVTMRQLLEVRKKAEQRGGDPRNVAVRLQLADGSIYGEAGTLNFIDVTVDPGTDTIRLRATLPNPKRQLVDGALVTVIVETSEPTAALVVPQGAVQFDQGGRFVLTVDKDNKVEVKRVTVGPSYGMLYAVEQGLSAGDLVITDGLQKVRPGIVVAPTEAPLPTAETLAPRS